MPPTNTIKRDGIPKHDKCIHANYARKIWPLDERKSKIWARDCEKFKTKWIVRCEKYHRTLSTHPVLLLRNTISPLRMIYHMMFVRICRSFLLQLIHQLLAADPLLNGPIWRNEDSFVALSVLLAVCFSEYLINRVRAVDLETYWSRHAGLALTDSATRTLLYEVSLPISPTVAYYVVHDFLLFLRHSKYNITLLLRFSPSATFLAADTIFRVPVLLNNSLVKRTNKTSVQLKQCP